MGMVGFHRRFIPIFTTTILLFQTLIGSANKKNHTLHWKQDQKKSCHKIKEKIMYITNLNFLKNDCNNYHLATDASNMAIGAALHQMVDGTLSLISFYSRKLIASKRNYSTFDKRISEAFLLP